MKFTTSYNLSGLINYFLVKQKLNVELSMDVRGLKSLNSMEPHLITNILDEDISYLDKENYTLIFNDEDNICSKFSKAKTICSKDKITSELIYEKFNSPKSFLNLVKIDKALKGIFLDNDFKKGIILNDMFYRKLPELMKLENSGDLSLIRSSMIETFNEIKEYNNQLIADKMIQEDGNALIAFKKHHNLGHFLFYDKKELYFTYSLNTRNLHILNFSEIEIEGDKIHNGVIIKNLSVKEAMNRIQSILALR